MYDLPLFDESLLDSFAMFSRARLVVCSDDAHSPTQRQLGQEQGICQKHISDPKPPNQYRSLVSIFLRTYSEGASSEYASIEEDTKTGAET